jgi:dihydropteroate synthase
VNATAFADWLIRPAPRRPLVMGILNVTPDSFSDGGKFDSIDAALAQAREMIAARADLIDVGGESTRPGSSPIPSQEQIERVVPVIQAIASDSDFLLSIDTTHADVATAALDAGAGMINDISAGRDDPRMFPLAAARRIPIVLMHMQGIPRTMQQNPVYIDVVKEVSDFLINRRQAAIAAGISSTQILFDPGIGFGKTDKQNLLLLRETARLAALGNPLLIGASRKAFIGRITGESAAADRLLGTAAVVGWCVANGAGISRVHDVAAMHKVIRMAGAIAGNLK